MSRLKIPHVIFNKTQTYFLVILVGLRVQTVRKLNRKSIENIARNNEIWYNKNVRNAAVMHIWREFYAIYKRRTQRSVNVVT